MLKLWRRSIDPSATPWHRTLREGNYQRLGTWSTIAGIGSLIIFIYKVCAHWVKTPTWFYYLSIGLVVLGIVLIKISKNFANPKDSFWDRILTTYYYILGVTSIICGITGLLFGIG
ncbi:MAG TPA: hypothetical protein VK809_00100 [Bacteroidia bacterium]|nr:hypothetical protein [Bacteroidia bacterium]